MINRRRLCVFGISCLIIIAAVLTWQWNNLMAILLFSRYSKSELLAKLTSEKIVSEEAIKKLRGNITDLTEEEKHKLQNGDITQEDAVKQIIKRSDSDNEPQSILESKSDLTKQNTISTPIPTEKIPPAEREDDKRIKEIVAKLVVLKTYYTDRIDNLVIQAKSEYLTLPKSERTAAKKQSLFLKYLGQASSMERTCDSTVSDIIVELRKLLIKTGGDMSLVNVIETTYKQEKSLKKAYYFNMLKNSNSPKR